MCFASGRNIDKGDDTRVPVVGLPRQGVRWIDKTSPVVVLPPPQSGRFGLQRIALTSPFSPPFFQWTPPAGTHLGVAYWANIIALGASLVAVFLMSLATIAERKRYQGRFKVMAPPPSVPAGQGGAQAGSGKTESTTAILGNDRSNISLAPSDIAAPPDANDDLEKGIPPPPPPPPK